MMRTLGSFLACRPKYGIGTAAVNYRSDLPAYLRITDIDEDGRFSPNPRVSVDSALSSNYYLAEGDLVVARTGASVGKSYLYRAEDGELVFAGFLINVRPDPRRLDPRYLSLVFQSKEYWDWVGSESTRSGQPGINAQQLFSFPLDPPAIDLQEEIAVKLADVDHLIASLERLIAKKRTVKQGMMQELLTGHTRLPGFSGEWVKDTLGAVSRIKTGSRNNQDKDSSGSYPFFVRSETVERIGTYTYDMEAILVPGEGGIGSIFHYINGKFEVHQRVYKISDFSPVVAGKFIYYYMRQFFGPHAMENSVKATVDSLRLPTFTSFELTLPPSRAEQAAIVEVLEHSDAEIDALERRLESTRAIKQGMMQELLTGRTRLPVTEEVSV